jgi:membrane protein
MAKFPQLKILESYKNLSQHKYVTEIIQWAKSHKMPGTGGILIYDIGHFIYEEIKKDNLTTRANSITFSLFLAIFPFIIFLFTLLPYLPFTENYTQAIYNTTQNFLPVNAHKYMMDIINDITKIKRGGLLSLGFVLALYFSSNGILSLMKGFDKTYKEHFKQRSLIYKRGVALMLTLMLSIILIGSIIFFVLGRFIFTQVDNVVDKGENNLLVETLFMNGLKILTSLSILFIGINVIYRFGPSFRKNLPFFNIGSITASVLILFTSIIFAFFINNFGKFNEIYGSIGALIVVLLWIKFNVLILLIGFELNAAITINSQLKKQ